MVSGEVKNNLNYCEKWKTVHNHFVSRIPLAILLLALLVIPPSAAPTATPISRTTAVVSPPAQSEGCGYLPEVDAILAQVNFDSWAGWVRQLSGAEDALLGGASVRITSRFSPALFYGPGPSAYDFVRERISAWYPAGQIEEDPYPTFWLQPGDNQNFQTWKNLVLTIPGAERPGEVVILSAHLDSVSHDDPNTPEDERYTLAPGADDNGTGAAALLEMARVLQGHALPRTLRLVWFTGEEQGLLGSSAYTADHDLDGVVGAINVDMIGYDASGDRCFELHTGQMPASQAIGQCFARVNHSYQLGLAYDYLTGPVDYPNTGPTRRSDHASFWDQNIGAVEVLENFFPNDLVGGCSGVDRTPYYHTGLDTFANMHPAFGFDVTRAALAAALSMASPVPLYTILFPW